MSYQDTREVSPMQREGKSTNTNSGTACNVITPDCLATLLRKFSISSRYPQDLSLPFTHVDHDRERSPTGNGVHRSRNALGKYIKLPRQWQPSEGAGENSHWPNQNQNIRSRVLIFDFRRNLTRKRFVPVPWLIR